MTMIQMIMCLLGEPIDIKATESDSATTKVSQVLPCAARADSECIRGAVGSNSSFSGGRARDGLVY